MGLPRPAAAGHGVLSATCCDDFPTVGVDDDDLGRLRGAVDARNQRHQALLASAELFLRSS
jgi:hypothetical protein